MKARRTQQERSETTRKLILEAAMRCLRDEGSSGATTTRIAELAGVSRGALLHHYPTRAQLMRAALEHVLEQNQARFLARIDGLPEGGERLSATIDALWESVSGETFLPWLELLVASRRDPELREVLESFARRSESVVEENFRSLYGLSGAEGDLLAQAPLIAFAFVDGLALRQLVLDDQRSPQLLAVFKRLSALFLLAALPQGSTQARS